MVHCDVMRTINDLDILQAFEDAEKKAPSPRKIIDENRTIYSSCKFRSPQNHDWGDPILCDLGEARIGKMHDYEEIFPEQYKPPEILLQIPWTSAVDIWSTACMVWDLVERNCHLFDGRDEEGYHNNRFHLSEMVAYLGPPPLELLGQSEHSTRVFDEIGQWKGSPSLPDLNLDRDEKELGGEEKRSFLAFMRSMLKWMPTERKSAKQLLQEAWMTAGS
jgi:serine/threonine-protein kinase SRPK3